MQLNGFEVTKETVPDYMHGALFGITKALLLLWSILLSTWRTTRKTSRTPSTS